SVIVTNGWGAVTSAVAVLTVPIFSQVTNVLTSGAYGHVSWDDIDNDGDLDLLVIGYDEQFSPHTWLYRNNGSGEFTEIMPIALPGMVDASADWADFNNDGRVDLVMRGAVWRGDSQATLIYTNDGSGGFS